MPEMIEVSENDFLFDQTVKRDLPEGGDISIAIKGNATEDGRPAAVISWTVQLPDGKKATVQAVSTTRLLIFALTGERL